MTCAKSQSKSGKILNHGMCSNHICKKQLINLNNICTFKSNQNTLYRICLVCLNINNNIRRLGKTKILNTYYMFDLCTTKTPKSKPSTYEIDLCQCNSK